MTAVEGAKPLRETQLRLEVATATRVLAFAGLFDMHGHISIREGDTIYICDRGASRLTVRPELIASVRVSDGKRLSDATPPSETAIHLAAYRAKPDVRSVAHFHPLYATAFAVAGKPLDVASNAGAISGNCDRLTVASAYGGVVPINSGSAIGSATAYRRRSRAKGSSGSFDLRNSEFRLPTSSATDARSRPRARALTAGSSDSPRDRRCRSTRAERPPG